MTALVDAFLSADALRASWTLLALGLAHTLRLIGLVFGLALALGGVLLGARLGGPAWLRAAVVAYVDVLRATPPMVLLVVVYYALPATGGPSLGVFAAGGLTLGLIHAAHVSEVYRAGWLAVDPGQRLAARALGHTEVQAAHLVLVPQVARVVLPPLTSQLTQVVRDSPLTLLIGYPELLTRARDAQGLTGNATPIAAAGVLFAAVLLALQALGLWLERRARRELVSE